MKQLPDMRVGLEPWAELLAREQLDRPPWAPTADPGSIATSKRQGMGAFQELHCAAKETEAQGRDRSHLSSLCCCQLILSSVFHAFALSHGPLAPTQPAMDQLSVLGATFALSGPLSPPPHRVAGKALGPTATQVGRGLSLLGLPLPSHL